MMVKINSWLILSAFVIFMGKATAYGQKVGEPGPDFEVNTLGGGAFKLSEQRGKVVFVFLFGNTCPSCKAIGPTVETSIHQEFNDNPDFVAIGLDTWDSSSGESSVTGFRNSTGITFPLAIKAGSVAKAYGTTYDRFMVIDRDGVLAHKGAVGAKNDVNTTKAVIEQSLMAATSTNRSAAEAGVRLFPMPASDELHIQSSEAISGVRIYDALGKLVLVENDLPGQGLFKRSLNVSTLERGLYFYRLQRKDGLVTGKLLIQR